MVTRNVAKLVDPPRVSKHEIRPLTPEQARRLIDSAKDDRFRAVYVTALGTGLRQGELLALRWEDVDLKLRRLRVRHTSPTSAARSRSWSPRPTAAAGS